jgi:hypothetical protein
MVEAVEEGKLERLLYKFILYLYDISFQIWTPGV